MSSQLLIPIGIPDVERQASPPPLDPDAFRPVPIIAAPAFDPAAPIDLARYRRLRQQRQLAVAGPPAVPARRAQPAVRLTRRGRRLLVGAVGLPVAALVVALALVFGHAVSAAAPASAGAAAVGTATVGTATVGTGAVTARTVVVQPGDTLWGIAVRSAPDADPRSTMQRIVDLNALPSLVLQPGQQLVLPS